jgi:hypothetical protein
LVIFRLIFNIPLPTVHRIITHKYYNVFPIIGKEFYLSFLFLETVKVRDNGFRRNMIQESSRVRGCLLVRHKSLRVVKSIVHEEEKIYYSSSSPSLCQPKFIVNVLQSSGKYMRLRYYCYVGETGVCEACLILSISVQFHFSRCLR